MISIAMCTFNGEKYLEDQLNSIINQTILPDEIVIYDDNSTDSTKEILKDFKKRNTIINIIINFNEINLGVSKNFNQAISQCMGEYIFLVDQDDIWEINKIEYLTREIDRQKKSVIFSNGNMINSSSITRRKSLWEAFNVNSKDIKKFESNKGIDVLLKKDVITGCTILIKKKFVDKIIPLNSKFVHDAWIGLIAELFDELGITQKELINYRIHGSQQIGLNNIKKKRSFETRRHDLLIEKYSELIEKIMTMDNFNKAKLIKVNDKIIFFQERNDLNFYNVAKNSFNLRYFKYSSGVKAIVLDLLLLKGEKNG